MAARPARVLCVCTANVCRSAAAELLLRAGLRARLGAAASAIEVSSAGVWASLSRPVEPGTAKALRRHGVSAEEIAGSFSRPLRREAVAAADLVLTATVEHVRAVWRLQLAARHRSFTLGELARLGEAVGPELLPPDGPAVRLRALVSSADAVREARRTPGRPYLSEAYDLPDPTDSDLAQREMVEQTAFHVEFLLDLIAGTPARRARVGAVRRLPLAGRAVQWTRSRAR